MQLPDSIYAIDAPVYKFDLRNKYDRTAELAVEAKSGAKQPSTGGQGS